MKKAVTSLAKGFVSFVCGITIGLVTLIFNAFMAIRKLVLKHPVCFLVILCAVLAFLLLFNYVRLSAKVKACEIQRDSIGYQLSKIEQAFFGDTIIIKGTRHVVEKMGTLPMDSDVDSITTE